LSTAADSRQPARRGLGRGLEVLIGGAATTTELVQLPVGAIKPNSRQPRRRFEAGGITELAESVQAQGLVQPVVVRPSGPGMWELIAGERRWRAARTAGLATVPALVREADDRDSLLLALVENVAREDLSPVEEARAYAVLIDEFGLSLGDVAERVGKSKPTVSNRIRLLELPEDVIGLLERGSISEGHARAILGVPDHDARRALARQVIRKGLTVRATERAARWGGARTKPRRTRRIDPALAQEARKAVEAVAGTPARVTDTRIEIPFSDETALQEIIEAFARVRP
jgi:ParB family transcriptional regulator, chromosome partitioning protein